MEPLTFLYNFFYNSPNAFFIGYVDGGVIDANIAACTLFGYTKTELIQQKRDQFLQIENLNNYLNIRNQDGSVRLEAVGIKKDKTEFPVEIFSWLIEQEGDKIISGSFIVDITQRKDMESAINNIHNLSNDLIGVAENGFFYNVNSACQNILGYTPEELYADKYINFVHPDDVEITNNETLKIRGGATTINFLNRNRCKNGQYKWLQWNLNYYKGKTYFIAHDIDKMIREKEHMKLLSSAVENASDSVIITEADPLNFPSPKILFVNDGVLKNTGYSREELIGKNPSIFHGPNTCEKTLNKIYEDLKEWKVSTVEIINYKKSGEEFWVSLSIVPIANEHGIYTHCVSVQKDITQQKLLEIQLQKSLRINQFVGSVNELVLRANTEQEIIDKIAAVSVSSGGFLFAWLGNPNYATRLIEPISSAGDSSGYLDVISQISMDDIPTGRGMSGKAFRTKRYYYCNDIESDEGMKPWRDKALKSGFHSSVSIPILLNNEVIYLLHLYSSQKNYFNQEEIQILIHVSDNISYAINALRNVIIRKEAEEKLSKLSVAIEQSSSSVVITDTNGLVEYVNKAFTQITGYIFDEVKGAKTSILKSGETTEKVYHDLWATITSNKTWKGELCNKKKNGELFWEKAVISPVVNEEGIITNYVAVKDDITNTRIAENKIRQYINIIEHSNAYIGIADMNGILLYLNANNKKIFELDEDEEVSKIKILDFFTDESIVVYHKDIVPQTINNGIWSGELTWKSRSGKLIPVIMVVMLHKDANGIPEFTSATAINITDIKNKEAELLKLNTNLRSLAAHLLEVREEERKTIAKEIHDELGQNLTFLKLDLSWIHHHLNDDKSILENRINSLLDITDDTISTSRRLYNTIYPKMIDDIGLIATIKWHANNYLQNQPYKLTITSNVPDELVVCDHNICLVLFRIYQESLTNITRYAEATIVTLDFIYEEDAITMELSDNGIGFDPASVDTKLHHGLMGMQERVMSLGGTLKIISTKGVGTNKIINIPLVKNKVH